MADDSNPNDQNSAAAAPDPANGAQTAAPPEARATTPARNGVATPTTPPPNQAPPEPRAPQDLLSQEYLQGHQQLEEATREAREILATIRDTVKREMAALEQFREAARQEIDLYERKKRARQEERARHQGVLLADLIAMRDEGRQWLQELATGSKKA